MYRLGDCPLGIYEKALPASDWSTMFAQARTLGFDFLEMSIDESDERLARLDWTGSERRKFVEMRRSAEVRVPSVCLSGNRRFPLGSKSEGTRNDGVALIRKAVDLADDIGVRVVQLAGYDVYYEPSDGETRQMFLDNLRGAVRYAEGRGVMLSMEIMDTKLMSSISRFLWYRTQIPSPWFSVYPDLGNLSAWNDNAAEELDLGLSLGLVAAVHLKDTFAVTCDSPGQFRDVPFGSGCVDFPRLLAVLKDHCYGGPLVIEMWNRGETGTDAVADAKAWIEGHRHSVDKGADQ